MKRFIGIFASIMAVYCGLAHADWTTSRMGLTKPTTGQADTWGRKLNQNFDIIDSSSALLGSSQTWDGYQTFTSSVSISTLTVSQIRVSTPTYSGSEKLAINGAVKMWGQNGSSLSLCYQNGTNCQNIEVSSDYDAYGIKVSTMTFKKIDFDTPQNSVFIGNGTGVGYVGNAVARPSVFVGNSAGGSFTNEFISGGVAGGITSVGYGSGAAVRGIKNTYIGDFAGAYHTDGSWNVFLGAGAGHGEGGNTSVVVSSDSIFIGQYTGGYSSAPLNNVVAIGAFSKVNRDNSFAIGVPARHSNGTPFHVGIGTDTPRATLSVVGEGGNYDATTNYTLYVSTGGTPNNLNDYHLAVSTWGVTSVKSIKIDSGGSSGKAMCWKTATTLGYCSSVVGAGGDCTCN